AWLARTRSSSRPSPASTRCATSPGSITTSGLVNRLSGGKLGYVYLPDTEWGGYKNFNRYFFSQVDKQGVIIDERFNHGGDLSDYIIQYLQRKPMALVVTRWSHPEI
ncbi:peptidase S41, partial [mine drainage metagenome]